MEQVPLRFLVEPGVSFEVPASTSVPFEVVTVTPRPPAERTEAEGDTVPITPAPPGGIDSAPVPPIVWTLPPIPVAAALELLEAITTGQTVAPLGSTARIEMAVDDPLDLAALDRFVEDSRVGSVGLSFEIAVRGTMASRDEGLSMAEESVVDTRGMVDEGRRENVAEGEVEGSSG